MPETLDFTRFPRTDWRTNFVIIGMILGNFDDLIGKYWKIFGKCKIYDSYEKWSALHISGVKKRFLNVNLPPYKHTIIL